MHVSRKEFKSSNPFSNISQRRIHTHESPIKSRAKCKKKNAPRPEGPQSVMNHCQPVPFFIEQVVQNKHRPSKESVNRKWHQRSRARLTEDITGDEPRMNNVANLWLSQCRKSFFVCFITCVCVWNLVERRSNRWPIIEASSEGKCFFVCETDGHQQQQLLLKVVFFLAGHFRTWFEVWVSWYLRRRWNLIQRLVKLGQVKKSLDFNLLLGFICYKYQQTKLSN